MEVLHWADEMKAWQKAEALPVKPAFGAAIAA
jgi:hypothetical protein